MSCEHHYDVRWLLVRFALGKLTENQREVRWIIFHFKRKYSRAWTTVWVNIARLVNSRSSRFPNYQTNIYYCGQGTYLIPTEYISIDIQNRHDNEIHSVQHFCHATVLAVIGHNLKQPIKDKYICVVTQRKFCGSQDCLKTIDTRDVQVQWNWRI